MEHNTDRILWTVLILAIGVSLYTIFRPAMASQAQVVVQTIASKLNDSSSSSGTVDSDNNSDFIYSNPNTANDTISIFGYKGKSTNLTIPTYRKIGSARYKVTAIGLGAFANNTTLISVDIPNSVTSIGNSAFSDDSNLKSLTLGSGVTSIGSYAFYDTPISAISFKSPVTLGDQTFRNTKLTNVTLPTGSTYSTGLEPTFDANVTVTVK